MTTTDLLATEPSESSASLQQQQQDSLTTTTPFTLRVKSSTFPDVSVIVKHDMTVLQCKQLIKEKVGGDAQNRYLRLISHGRLLAPDTAELSSFKLKHDNTLHAVFAQPGVRGGQQALLQRSSNSTTRRYRGTGVNAHGRAVRPTSAASSDDEEADDDSDDGIVEEGRERLGFDRLRATGLSRQEIAAIRSYFSRHVDRYVLEHPEAGQETTTTTTAEEDSENPTTTTTTDAARRRLLQEDAWMQSQGPTSEFRLNLNQNLTSLWMRGAFETTNNNNTVLTSRMGTDRDFLFGILLGFFVGFWMLVWVWMPQIPHKQKLGILTGISIQLALTLLRSHDEVADLDE